MLVSKDEVDDKEEEEDEDNDMDKNLLNDAAMMIGWLALG